MSVIPAGLRRLVIRRAANACEYCGLPQEGQEATFHIDHVMPRVAGGETRVAMTYHYTIHAAMIGRRISGGKALPSLV